jgi:hypothetical protein
MKRVLVGRKEIAFWTRMDSKYASRIKASPSLMNSKAENYYNVENVMTGLLKP